MIKKQEYLKAKKIVDAYNEQLRVIENIRIEQLKEKQFKREEECEDHYYLPSGGKWSPIGQISCQYCGKTIE